jgi:L-idonate 5-dehydrogenase
VFAPTRPFVLGHELVATVDSVGDGVADLSAGARVVVHPARSCGHCPRCKAGRGNLCENVVVLGSASTDPPTDGALAEYVVVADHQCYPVPDALDDQQAALMEPLSVVLHALNRAPDITGASVLVTGGGPIGLLAAVAARACGAGLVMLSEPVAARREAALALGADGVLDPTQPTFADDAQAASAGGFDVILEASGAPAALTGAFDAAGRGATIVQIGMMQTDEAALPVNRLMTREIDLVGSFRYVGEFADAIRLVAGGRIDLRPLIRATLELEETKQAIEQAGAPQGAGKVLVTVAT